MSAEICCEIRHQLMSSFFCHGMLILPDLLQMSSWATLGSSVLSISQRQKFKNQRLQGCKPAFQFFDFGHRHDNSLF